jgi:sugar-specific transcriptional regulator TrmB
MRTDEKTIELLKDFGLHENEASVYLASLSLGATTILKLANKSGVNRTTVYEIVEALERKGLMKKEIKGLKTLFSPEHPTRLENTLEAKRSALNRLLPELESKYHLKGTGSTIKYYEGLTAIKNVYDELAKELKSSDFYYVVSNTAEWQAIDDSYFMKNHVELFSHKKVDRRVLFVDSPEAQKRKLTERNFNEQVKILPGNANIHVDLCITPYKLLIFQLHQPLVALVIENETMIETQKIMFEMLWDKS